MKKQIFLLLLMVLFPFLSNAYTSVLKVDGIYYVFFDNTAVVTNSKGNSTGGNSYKGNIIIPETVIYGGKSYTVAKIGAEAFRDCTGLTSVSIPNSVAEIEDYSFRGCTGLISVTISNNVMSIGNNAFQNCSSLSSITIPYNVTTIGDNAFNGCGSMTSITFGNRVTTIGKYAFKDCKSLISVAVGNCVKNIGGYAFQNCSNLTSLTIPKSVTSIGNFAFEGCSSLSSVTINCEKIDSWFSYCNSLKMVTLGNDVKTIMDGAFKACYSLKSVIVPNSVISIGNNAFESCNSLDSIIIPNGVNSIGESAFSGCNSLTSVTIPNSVTSLGEASFKDCRSLKSVILPNSLSKINDGTFSGCRELSNIVIPNTVTSIGSSAFAGCTRLDAIYISNLISWCHISFSKGWISDCKYRLFLNDELVNNMEIPLMPQHPISAYAFANCISLTSITIPYGVTTIGGNAFIGCDNLKSLTFHCTEIGLWFNGLKSVEKVSIGDEVKTILPNAFNDCTSLKVVTFSDNITSVGNGSFPNGAELLVNSGTITLLSIWKAGFTPYEFKTQKKLPVPSISLDNATQVSLALKIDNMYNGYTYKIIRSYSDTINATSNTVVFSGLLPERAYAYDLIVSKDLVKYYKKFSGFKTKDIKPSLKVKSRTASSITIDGDYIKGDADVMDYYFYYNKKEFKGPLKLTGLDPNTTPNVTYEIVVRESDNIYESYSDKNTTSIYALKFVTLQPKVISPGNVIVAAESNLDDEETNVGFEWRRTDWTDDFPSNTGQAFLYEGQLEGYIRNLNTEKLWKFRPYYESASGNRYYGEWMGLDPTNTSYFEPTVHTYAKVEVQGNTANVRGYAMRGSDNITSQGFMYWKQTAASRSEAPSIPSSAQTVTAKGNVMEASLTNLDYETTYCYVAFATTAEGETFYGDQRQFTTGEDVTIIEPSMATTEPAKPVAYYDLSGRHIDKPQQGLVIARMSDGTTRKMVVKK